MRKNYKTSWIISATQSNVVELYTCTLNPHLAAYVWWSDGGWAYTIPSGELPNGELVARSRNLNGFATMDEAQHAAYVRAAHIWRERGLNLKIPALFGFIADNAGNITPIEQVDEDENTRIVIRGLRCDGYGRTRLYNCYYAVIRCVGGSWGYDFKDGMWWEYRKTYQYADMAAARAGAIAEMGKLQQRFGSDCGYSARMGRSLYLSYVSGFDQINLDHNHNGGAPAPIIAEDMPEVSDPIMAAIDALPWANVGRDLGCSEVEVQELEEEAPAPAQGRGMEAIRAVLHSELRPWLADGTAIPRVSRRGAEVETIRPPCATR